VEKVVYALWRDADTLVAAWSVGLRAAGVDVLPAAGALGVQVNVADEAVAPALLRMAEIDPQMEAVVSVWVDSARTAARGPLDDALAAVPGTARVEAYLVTESFLRRPAAMTPEAWIAAWHDGHTQVAIDTQSTFGYVQNVVARRLTPGAPAVDGIVEELFPIKALTDMHAFFDAPDDAELARRMGLMAESTARFGADRALDLVPTSRYVLSTPSNSSR
jgi:hypothetical protein